eukprot:Tamp_03873.p1 GENE.Tamp_03873~~Tamp_03873.p1  ORF type:complete len:139 (+),score=9.96 Tamp_03873:96-512(+)
MAKGHAVDDSDEAARRKIVALPICAASDGAPVQPAVPAAVPEAPYSYGAVRDTEVLTPHSVYGANPSQRRVRRVAMLLAALVILVKVMMLLSASSKHPRPPPLVRKPKPVWHAAATPNHIRPGFEHGKIPPQGDVVFH